MRFKKEICHVSDFKLDDSTGEFTCYGNTKGNIDHALDRTLDGAYQGSIDEHKSSGTMPKMFWSHKSRELPVGPWLDMEEDNVGLKMKGRLSKTSLGNDIEILAKDGALDSFSIGYNILEEQWNSDKRCNDLIKLDIKEVSWVNFACNEESRLVDIKGRLAEGELLSKADLRILLEQTSVGLSKRQIEGVTANYNPKIDNDMTELKGILESSLIFQ
tara:strand:- start:443 stop:1090 length:648 start_codon:yes stop_codon:yes gene_type:complete